MNIIFLSRKAGSNRHVSLTHRQLLVMTLAGGVFLPVFLGVLLFQIQGMVSRYNGTADATLLAAQKQELLGLRGELAATRGHAETHLNALTQRLGRMQAQMLRLDALGGRLTRMAKLDPQEFDFSQTPAMGGPETDALAVDSADFLKTLKALEQLSEAMERKAERLTALESLLLDRQVTAAVTPSGWPAQGGWVSSLFGIRADPFSGRRAYHEGVDIAARLGSLVKAMGDGVISYSGVKLGYGLMVEVTHGQGYATRYAHTAETLVKVGDRVVKGEPIARIGSSGRSTGPHLHFEVRRDGRAVDPQQYLLWESRNTPPVVAKK